MDVTVHRGLFKDAAGIVRQCVFQGHESQVFNDSGKTVSERLLDILRDLSAPFDSTASYLAGACCFLPDEDRLYKFISDKAPGDWDNSIVEQVTLVEIIKDVEKNLTDKINDDVLGLGTEINEKLESYLLSSSAEKPYRDDKSYYAGDVCTRNGKIYCFVEDKTPGDWDDAKVEEITVGRLIRESRASVVNEIKNTLKSFVLGSAIASNEFSEDENYNLGDKVFYDSKLYRFIQNKLAGSWDASMIEEITLFGLLDEIEANVRADIPTVPTDYAKMSALAPEFDTTKAYVTGDYISYKGLLYKVITDKPAGDWDSAKVETTKVVDLDIGGGGQTIQQNVTKIANISPNGNVINIPLTGIVNNSKIVMPATGWLQAKITGVGYISLSVGDRVVYNDANSSGVYYAEITVTKGDTVVINFPSGATLSALQIFEVPPVDGTLYIKAVDELAYVENAVGEYDLTNSSDNYDEFIVDLIYKNNDQIMQSLTVKKNEMFELCKTYYTYNAYSLIGVISDKFKITAIYSKKYTSSEKVYTRVTGRKYARVDEYVPPVGLRERKVLMHETVSANKVIDLKQDMTEWDLIVATQYDSGDNGQTMCSNKVVLGRPAVLYYNECSIVFTLSEKGIFTVTTYQSYANRFVELVGYKFAPQENVFPIVEEPKELIFDGKITGLGTYKMSGNTSDYDDFIINVVDNFSGKKYIVWSSIGKSLSYSRYRGSNHYSNINANLIGDEIIVDDFSLNVAGSSLSLEVYGIKHVSLKDAVQPLTFKRSEEIFSKNNPGVGTHPLNAGVDATKYDLFIGEIWYNNMMFAQMAFKLGVRFALERSYNSSNFLFQGVLNKNDVTLSYSNITGGSSAVSLRLKGIKLEPQEVNVNMVTEPEVKLAEVDISAGVAISLDGKSYTNYRLQMLSNTGMLLDSVNAKVGDTAFLKFVKKDSDEIAQVELTSADSFTIKTWVSDANLNRKIAIYGINEVNADDLVNKLALESVDTLYPRTAITEAGIIALSKSASEYDQVIATLYGDWAGSIAKVEEIIIEEGTTSSLLYNFDAANKIGCNVTVNGSSCAISNITRTSSVDGMLLKIVGYKFVKEEPATPTPLHKTEMTILYENDDVQFEASDYDLSNSASNFDLIVVSVYMDIMTTSDTFHAKIGEITMTIGETACVARSELMAEYTQYMILTLKENAIRPERIFNSVGGTKGIKVIGFKF